VFDESGALVHGPAGPVPEFSARARVPLVFYPEQDIRRRMAEAVSSRPWSISLAPARGAGAGDFASTETQGYWLSGLSVLLMFVALALVVRGQRQAAELARIQTEFVAQVSHQLKTPLAVLSAVTETLTFDRVRSPEKTAQYLAILRTETSRLAALVGRILEFARVEGRTPKYELEDVDLGALVRETIEAIAPGLERDGVVLQVHAESPSPVVVADPVALEQVLLNLVDNAAKYSRPSRHVIVRVRTIGVEARLDVADRGPGVPPAERHRIFERFYRGSGAAASPDGFGLGLAIAAEIVRSHGGRIELESPPGGGALFKVSLPLAGRGVSAGARVGPQAALAPAGDARSK
jgi:signal transduction histidine kinase